MDKVAGDECTQGNKLASEKVAAELLRPHASFKLNPADADAAGVIGAGTLSLQQSFGFLEYTDEQWARLQSIYLSQSSRQRGYPHSEPSLFWTKNWHSTLSCAFERRLGNKGDGGKWVCDAYRLAAQKECNVISVGSDNEWSFEIAIHQLNPRCKIYTFDYSRNPIGKPDFVTYLSFGLGAHNMSCAGIIFNTSPYTPICRHTDGLWEELLTLSSAVKMIGLEGKKIDILKMDCEGCEYVVLSELDQVFCQQVLVEVHKFEVVPVAPIEDMMQNNYVIFHREPNLLTRGNDMEFSFIKLHPQFTKHMHGDQHPSVAILFDGNIGLFCKYNSSGWIVSMELHAWIRGLMPACQYIVMVEELSVDGGGGREGVRGKQQAKTSGNSSCHCRTAHRLRMSQLCLPILD